METLGGNKIFVRRNVQGNRKKNVKPNIMNAPKNWIEFKQQQQIEQVTCREGSTRHAWPLSWPSLSSYSTTGGYEAGHTDTLTSLEDINLFFYPMDLWRTFWKGKTLKNDLCWSECRCVCPLYWLFGDKSNKLTPFIRFQVFFFYPDILRALL